MRNRELSQLAEQFGCALIPTNNGHFRLQHPEGWFVYCPGSPSDHRSMANAKAQLRRSARQKAVDSVINRIVVGKPRDR